MTATPEPVATLLVDRGVGPNQPVKVVLLGGLQVVLIRATRTYAQTLVGLLAISLVAPAGVVTGDPLALGRSFWGSLAYAAVASLAPALISILQNGAELLARLDETAPQLRG